MALTTKIGNMSYRGFTLMELLVVLLLIALLASIVTPVVTKSIKRAEESTLKEDLFILRKAIDDYYADNGAYPEDLNLLVEKHYIRAIPKDPITDSQDAWIFKRVESEEGASGIIDVHSGSQALSLEGAPYNEW